ncbi:uncharacterized protein LOC131883387 [Tigriopus californicus]|uniref:uncharacterized protein LOC131883387 n=1 Tax=Tigriopus californicus TaxID=6832 RepID=UPI0027DA849A|nr:uncharacterized protein LOC131883387 [Tigriopus californicus]
MNAFSLNWSTNAFLAIFFISQNIKLFSSVFSYSYDLRGRAPNQAQHWADAHVLGNRANFYLSRPVDQWDNNGLLTRNPGDKRRPIEDRLPVGTSVLTIRGISTQDRGLYRCRVDFHAAPTRNSMANLTVVVPPKVPVIVDETGHEAESYIGPYVEEASIPVACEVRGGKGVYGSLTPSTDYLI